LTIRVVAKCHVKPEKAQEFIDMCKKLLTNQQKKKTLRIWALSGITESRNPNDVRRVAR